MFICVRGKSWYSSPTSISWHPKFYEPVSKGKWLNKWFCSSCNLLCDSTRETCIINSAPILIIKFCRFPNQGGQLVKNENFFSCTQSKSNKDLAFPITIEDEVSFTNKYSLIATINHSDTLNRGHYWAFIKDLHSSTWYSCNDKSVFNVEENYVSNNTSYIPFYSNV